MKELIVQSKGKPIHAFFVFNPERKGIVLCAGKEKRFYSGMIQIADREYSKHLKNKNEMAEALGIKQPSVAMIEKPRRDLKISSLKRYVEAIGGKLRLDVELPDGSNFGVSV